MNWNDDSKPPQTPEQISRGASWIAVGIATAIALPILTLIFQAVAR